MYSRWMVLLAFAGFLMSNSTASDLPPNEILPFANMVLVTYPDPRVSCDSASCIIPFRRAGNLILIDAKADSIKGGFILDTGAPHLVLNITYFRDYPAKAVPVAGGITGSFPSASKTSIDEFSLGPVKYFKVDADLVDLGHIEDTKGTRIFGLLGVNLFKRFEMIIDYSRSVIYLHLIKKNETNSYLHEMLVDSMQYTTLPFDIIENKIITKAEIAGKKLKFIIDTGAESNVLDSRLPDKIFESVTISRRVMLTGTGSNKVEALYGDLESLSFGTEKLDSLPVLITNLEQMCLSYDYCLDGMLGFDFLSQQKIGFNFVKREMYLWK